VRTQLPSTNVYFPQHNIFLHKLTFVQFTRLAEQSIASSHDVSNRVEGSKVRKDADSSSATSRVRVLGNTVKQIRVSLLKTRA
jgi:hypothetical protein